MAKPPLQFRTYAPASITIAGHPIALRIKRQNINEFAEFDRLWHRAFVREADRLVIVRRPGEEQERRSQIGLSVERQTGYAAALQIIEASPSEKVEEVVAKLVKLCRQILTEVTFSEDWLIPDAEIKRRRMLEMTDQERVNYDRAVAEDQAAFEAAVHKGLKDFVRVVPGQIAIEDEAGQTVEVTTGEQLEQCIGSEPNVLFEILLEIRRANTLSDLEKNGSGSPSTSSLSSSERDLKAHGAPPAPAEAAATTDSATTAGATLLETSASGSTVM